MTGRVAIYVPRIPDENTTPPLGPLYLLAVLEREGFDGRLFDARIDRHAFQKMVAFGPTVVGISAVTAGILGGLLAARRVKEIFPEVPVVFGGPHPTSLPADVAAEPCVDYVLVGESETSFIELCRRLMAGDASAESLSQVKNLVFEKGGGITSTGKSPRPTSEQLDDLPWPAFHRMDLSTYFSGSQAHGLFRRGKRVLPLMTTRGCPYSCTFCCRVMGQSVRRRSVDSVVAEVRYLVNRYGIDELYVEDDNFTVDRERALEMLDRLAAHKPRIHLKFANGIRADRVDREILSSMKAAGVYSLSFGIESGSPATLTRMKKNLDLGRARENILLAKSLGLLVGSNCIIGYPGETVQDVDTSLDFFLGLPLDSMAIVNLVPFPGTEVREICEREGYLTAEAANWDNYFFSINDPIPLVETPSLPREKLAGLVHRAYRKMYLRPKWIWRSLRELSPGQMALGAAVVLGLRARKREREATEL